VVGNERATRLGTPLKQPAAQHLEAEVWLQVTASKWPVCQVTETLTQLIATAQLVEIIPEMIVIPHCQTVN
jgi:hypothetical protein